MSKSTKCQILIIIVLLITLCILVKFTKDSIDENNMKPGNFGQDPKSSENNMNNNSKSVDYSAVNEFNVDEEISSGEYSSSKADENAILVDDKANVKISNVTVEKTGD